MVYYQSHRKKHTNERIYYYYYREGNDLHQPQLCALIILPNFQHKCIQANIMISDIHHMHVYIPSTPGKSSKNVCHNNICVQCTADDIDERIVFLYEQP